MFEDIVNTLAEFKSIQAVGISGGEPFVEKRGLEYSVQRLSQAQKKIVLYTSGHWGNSGRKTWVDSILNQVNTVVLSTDAFHNSSITAEVFSQAIQRIADSGAWLIIQVIPSEQTKQKINNTLIEVFGESWHEFAEINEIPLLNHGRAQKYFPPPVKKTIENISKCTRSNSPVVRYDGVITACTNESVIAGKGPKALRQQITEGKNLAETLANLSRNKIIKALAVDGPNALDAEYNLVQQRFCNVCDVCWHVLNQE